LFPKDLIQAHARTSKLVEARKDELNSKLIASRAKEINSLLAFKSDGLLIRAISSFDELIAEGRELNHCVAGYAQKHADGETTIMVIRRTDEPYKPFYTLECDIKSKTVCQCRGNHNCSMTPEVSKFVSQWEKAKLKNQLKQEPQLTA